MTIIIKKSNKDIIEVNRRIKEFLKRRLTPVEKINLITFLEKEQDVILPITFCKVPSYFEIAPWENSIPETYNNSNESMLHISIEKHCRYLDMLN